MYRVPAPSNGSQMDCALLVGFVQGPSAMLLSETSILSPPFTVSSSHRLSSSSRLRDHGAWDDARTVTALVTAYVTGLQKKTGYMRHIGSFKILACKMHHLRTPCISRGTSRNALRRHVQCSTTRGASSSRSFWSFRTPRNFENDHCPIHPRDRHVFCGHA